MAAAVAERLVRSRGSTSPDHGAKPAKRPVDEYVRRGAVVLDKPEGPSSHQVAAWVRDIFDVDKAGHAGTLDPNVTGLLPIGLADATKSLEPLKAQDKAYVGVIELHDDVPRNRIEEALSTFTGDVYQRPPKRSAVKRQLRVRRIDDFEAIEIDERRLLARVDCEGGTYIRKLAHDVGTYLGVGAHLDELRRTRVGHITEDRAVTLHDVKDAWEEFKQTGRDDWLREAVIPFERLLDHLPRITVRDTAVDAVCHGAPLAIPGVLDIERTISAGDQVVLMTLKGEAVALAEAEKTAVETIMQETGVVARPHRQLMDEGTYPQHWGEDEAEDA
jgi:H/ACA ribonucleoprotein complex subunit 4